MELDQDALVLAARELQPLPATITRLMGLLTRPDWEMSEVEEAVALDLALTPRILRVANSTLASRGIRVTTISDAVMRVGTGPLFSMAMALGVKKRLQQAVAQYGLAEGELWEHSVAAALTAESLGARLRRKLPVESFTAALLHDVGKLVMARFLEPSHLASLRAAEERGRLSERDAELEILGVDHAEIGAVVAQYWSLPDPLVRAIRFHHSPELAFAMDPWCRDPADAAAHVVHVADLVSERVAARRKRGGPALPQEPLAEATSAALELDAAALDELVQSVDERLNDVLARYS